MRTCESAVYSIASVQECPRGQTEVIEDRLDPSRVAIATVVAAELGVGLAAAFLRHAQGTGGAVGPTSATPDEAFSAFFGAGLGLALGSAFCALVIRRALLYFQDC